MAKENDIVLDDPFNDFDFEQITELFWFIYNSKETLFGEFSNPKFITENPKKVNYLVKSMQNRLNGHEIKKFIEKEWHYFADANSRNQQKFNLSFAAFNSNRKAHTDKLLQAAWNQKSKQHIDNASTPPPPSQATNLEILKMFRNLKEENENLKEENENLKVENKIVKQRLNEYEGTNLFSLSIDQLNSLSSKLNQQMQKINNIIQQTCDLKTKCSICMDAEKNIVIQDCGHFVLCANCATNLSKKVCPQCQRAYTNTFQIRL